MGRQVRFVLSDDDVSLLEGHVREVGGLFIPMRSGSPELNPRPGLEAPNEPWGWGAAIIRQVDLPTARRTYQPTPLADPPSDGYWAFDRDSAPRLDYTRGNASPPREGRLHFDTTRLEGGRIVPVDPEVVAWADALITWVRRTFQYNSAAQNYVGPAKTRRRRQPSDIPAP